jgi:hypothetical protein
VKRLILTILVSGFVTCAVFTRQAQAIAIQGHITFSGGLTLNTGDANTATSVTGWSNTIVESIDGDFASSGLVHGNAAVFVAPWIFAIPPNPGIPSFWTVAAGGGWSFDLSSSSITGQGGGFLFVSGTGVIHHAGFDDTAGTWSFSTQNPLAGGQFSFSAADGAVPDGGATVALLGLALAGIEGMRRKLKRDKQDD